METYAVLKMWSQDKNIQQTTLSCTMFVSHLFTLDQPALRANLPNPIFAVKIVTI